MIWDVMIKLIKNTTLLREKVKVKLASKNKEIIKHSNINKKE